MAAVSMATNVETHIFTHFFNFFYQRNIVTKYENNVVDGEYYEITQTLHVSPQFGVNLQAHQLMRRWMYLKYPVRVHYGICLIGLFKYTIIQTSFIINQNFPIDAVQQKQVVTTSYTHKMQLLLPNSTWVLFYSTVFWKDNSRVSHHSGKIMAEPVRAKLLFIRGYYPI